MFRSASLVGSTLHCRISMCRRVAYADFTGRGQRKLCFWHPPRHCCLSLPFGCFSFVSFCFYTMVIIQPVHSEGDQPWDFFGRNDAKAETPVLWPPHVKSWLTWGQEEKGTTEDEIAGWHHWLDGRESEWTPGVGDGQGGLACCDSWGHKESDTTEQLNWTELNHTRALSRVLCVVLSYYWTWGDSGKPWICSQLVRSEGRLGTLKFVVGFWSECNWVEDFALDLWPFVLLCLRELGIRSLAVPSRRTSTGFNGL